MKKFATQLLLAIILGSLSLFLIDKTNLSALLILVFSSAILIASVLPDIPNPDC